MISLQQRLLAFIRAFIPTTRVTLVNPFSEPSALAQLMTVDRVQDVFRSAESGDARDLFALYRDMLLADSHLQGELAKRKLTLLGDPLSIQPADRLQSADHAAAAAVGAMIQDCPTFLAACSHLLDATLWPVAVVEKIYRATASGYVLDQLVPVPHQLLDFTRGVLNIRATDPISHFPTGILLPPDPERYIIYRGHLLTTPDHWGGPMRSLVLWWLLGAMTREWWGRFLDRYGAPFLVGKYPQSDDASRAILERAFSWATKIGGLVVSDETQIDIKQASSNDSGQAYETFLLICNREKSKLIVGQTLSAEAQSTGMGSGVAKAQAEVRGDIRQWDALSLGTALRNQLAEQILRINHIPGRTPRFFWGGESIDAAGALGDLLAKLTQSQLQPSDEALAAISERIGFGIVRCAAPPAGLTTPPFTGARPALSWGAPVPLAPAAPREDDPQRAAALEADAANDRLARVAAPDLAQAFRGSLAPVRRIIRESRSAEECEQRLREFYADWPAGRLAGLVAEALTALAANGAARGVYLP